MFDSVGLTLFARICNIAAVSPLAPALSAGTRVVDYLTLTARAGRLAGHLNASGIGRGAVVGICLDRSFEQIASILAVTATGAAFLPIDPTWPDEYIRRLLDDAGAARVISSGARLRSSAGNYDVLSIDDLGASPQDTASFAAANVGDDDLCCVIYTSGSTGAAKGVEITNGNLRNLIEWHRSAFAIGGVDRVGHVAGLGFDAALWEVWPALAAGACVVLVPDACRHASNTLQDWLVEQAITVAFVPTVLATPMIAASWPSTTALRYLLTGGESLQRRPRPALPFAVINNYGPTECTVVATSGIVLPASDDPALPTIGRPIANVRIGIVDPSGAAIPPGEVGEILISGRGVCRGYRNRPDLTAERFVRDPGSGDRSYRTGDLGRLLPDGQIAFCGRIDAQEKIRGHRVEPDAIVQALNRHPTVLASAVAGHGAPPQERQLVAYLVVGEKSAPTAADLRAHLAMLLPDYMIPASFVQLVALPVTSAGKLDRDALPPPSPCNGLEPIRYRSPETATEGRVAEIIADLLQLGRVGADDDFFLLGGHSLLASQVVLRCRDEFGVDLKLLHLFEAQTVANLAVVIEQQLIAKLEAMSDEDAALLLAG